MSFSGLFIVVVVVRFVVRDLCRSGCRQNLENFYLAPPCVQTPPTSPQEKSEGSGRVCTQTSEGGELCKLMSQLKIMPIASRFKRLSLNPFHGRPMNGGSCLVLFCFVFFFFDPTHNSLFKLSDSYLKSVRA